MCNEVAYTNVLGLSDIDKIALTEYSGAVLSTYGKPLLINSAVSSVQWWDYFVWNIAANSEYDCTPEMYGKMPMTYKAYLTALEVGI